MQNIKFVIPGLTLKELLKVLEDRVNSENIDAAIAEFEDFCKRKEEENYINNCFEIETVKVVYDKLKNIKMQKNN